MVEDEEVLSSSDETCKSSFIKGVVDAGKGKDEAKESASIPLSMKRVISLEGERLSGRRKGSESLER